MNKLLNPLLICIRPEALVKINTSERIKKVNPITIDSIIEFLRLLWKGI